MSEVNVLWSSAWATLQKNLASSLAAPVAIGASAKAPLHARILPTGSWLVRARSRKTQASRIIQ